MPLAGKYRLIDIPLSNCINSGLNGIYVLTQFNSVSLHRHIRRAYAFDQFSAGFVEILAAQQTLDAATWYQGTADAVRQNLRYVEQDGVRTRADPLRRSTVSHEFSGNDGYASRNQGRCHHCGHAGRSANGPQHGTDARRRERPRGGFSGKAADRQGDRHGADGSGLDRRPRNPQPGPRLPGQHGHLPVQSRGAGQTADQDRLPRFRPRDLSGGHAHASRAGSSVRRLLGRHRHDSLVLRRQPGVGGREPAVRPGRRHGADLHPGPVFAALAIRRRDDSPQPDRRRLRDRGRRDDREQRDRPAVPHRARRHDSQFDPHGQRRVRNGRPMSQPRPPGNRWRASAPAR